MCHDKQWTTICYGGFKYRHQVAPVICRQLGFPWPNWHKWFPRGEYFVGNVKCRGDEHNISQCGRAEWNDNCTKLALGMECEPGIGKHEDTIKIWPCFVLE